MKRANGELPIVKAAGILCIGLMLATVSSCTKHAPPPPPPAPVETPAPAPKPAEPTEVVTEAPIPPSVPQETVEDLDDVIRQQNASRSMLKTIHFDFDQYTIRDDQVPILQSNAAWLKAHGQYKLVVEGHCDERDTVEYNLALGDRRAKAVLDYLADLGLPQDRIRKISYGKERPADPGHDETAWSANRRAEFTLEK